MRVSRVTRSRRGSASSTLANFLEAAKLLDAPDVVATCAIHAAIAASDAITCHALGERSNDGNRGSAVDLLRQVDAKLATALRRALDRKTQAGHESLPRADVTPRALPGAAANSAAGAWVAVCAIRRVGW